MKHLSIFLAALVVLIGLAVFDGTQAQKMTTGDGNGGPSSAPVPVSVMNLPTTQQVAGTVGIGHTVNVTGSVAVTNFPAVQGVSGTVDVGNLPLDADGNVRVAGQSAAPTYRWIQVADQLPLTPGVPVTFGPLDVAGWRTAAFLFGPTESGVSITVRYGGNGFFATEGTVGTNTGLQMFPTEVHGPEAQVIIGSSFEGRNITLWLYLSN